MYIKDDSFYEEIRNTTTARMYLLRPVFTTMIFMVDNMNLTWPDGQLKAESGIFEPSYDYALQASRNDTLYFYDCHAELKGGLPDGYYSFVIIYSAGRAPAGSERVVCYDAWSDRDGSYVRWNFEIPASNTGFQIESMHLCRFLPVDPQHISLINHKEKNDIILSSIPYNDIEVELFDEDRAYADFIKKSGKKLRVLLHYQYNEVQSGSFLYYYDKVPIHDTKSGIHKTTASFVGLMGALSTSIYYETGAYLQYSFIEARNGRIKEYFNNGGLMIGDHDGECEYGGQFFTLYEPFRTQKECFTSNNGSEWRESLVYTPTSPHGYSVADAIRLLVNAKSHVLVVSAEKISVDPLNLLVNELTAHEIVLTPQEYFSPPQKQEYPEIDLIKFATYHEWVEGSVEDIPAIHIDYENDGRIVEYQGNDWKVVIAAFPKLYKDLTYSWPLGTDPTELYPDQFKIVEGSGALIVMWECSLKLSGEVAIVVTGVPIEPSDAINFEKRYSEGKSVLELDNPFIMCRNKPNQLSTAVHTWGMPDNYAQFNYEQQSGKTIYTLETRGRFDVHPLDRFQFTNDDNELRYGIVIEHNMKFNGAMRSTLRVVDDGPVEALLADDDKRCDNILICR